MPERHGRASVSGLFAEAARVDDALRRLSAAGVPRDLIEVVVSPAAAKRFYGKRASPLGSEGVRFAAIGGLVGLFAGIGISLVMVLIPGRDLAPGLYLAQLLGPNAGSTLGAVLGGLVGATRPRRGRGVYRRAFEREAILLVVRSVSPEEIPRVQALLGDAGGEDVRAE